MPEYRKRIGSDTWHWCTDCPDWPTDPKTYLKEWHAAKARPKDGELDNKCLARERDGECRTTG